MIKDVWRAASTPGSCRFGEAPVSRDFLKIVMGNKDEAVRKAELAKVLTSLKLEAAKDEALVWKGRCIAPRRRARTA